MLHFQQCFGKGKDCSVSLFIMPEVSSLGGSPGRESLGKESLIQMASYRGSVSCPLLHPVSTYLKG